MRRPLFCVCAAFALGCAAAQYLLAPALWLTAAGCMLALGALGLLLHGEMRRRVLLCALGAAFAFGWSAAYAHFIAAPNEALIGQTDDVELELCTYAVETNYGAKATVRILDRGLHGKAVYYGGRGLLDLEPGERVRDTVFFNSAADPSDDGSHIRNFTAKGVYLLLYSRGEPTHEKGSAGALRYAPQRIAKKLGETIEAVYGEREGGFLRALLLGDKRYLDVEDSSNLSEAGIYHITAVSGLHCMFLVELLDRLLRASHRRIRCAVTIPLLFLYAVTVGASPSILRACVMLSMTQLAPLFRREKDPPTALGFALLLILLKNPYAIASISLQLSFSAVAGLVWLTPKMTRAIHTENRLLRFVLTSFATTLGALAFSAPLGAYYFGSFSVVSLLSNLLCLWMVSLVFGAGLLGLVLSMAAPALGAVFVPLVSLGVRYVLFVSGALESLPLHALYFNTALSALWLAYAYALLAVCAVARRGKHRWWIAGALAVTMLLATARFNALQFERGSLHITALDVGQGESVALLSKRHAVLVDCGSSNSYISAGDVAADYFLSAGIRRLDAVVLTHYHADHANGLALLLARVGVDALYLPDIAEEDGERSEVLALAERYGVELRYVTEEAQTAVGEASLTLYPPVGESGANELGLTVVCSSGAFDALITGDMDGKTEQVLVSAYTLPDIEVLLVGHHGSRYSTSKELLNAVTPEVGVVSVGNNSYGHPTRDALLRLTDAGVAVYRTDLQGNIHITVN